MALSRAKTNGRTSDGHSNAVNLVTGKLDDSHAWGHFMFKGSFIAKKEILGKDRNDLQRFDKANREKLASVSA